MIYENDLLSNQENQNELFFVVPDTARVIKSESKAIDIATRFFEGSDFYTRGNKESSVAKVCLDNGEPALYIVNFGNEEGFVIISASKDAAPILAYSETGAFYLDGIEGSPMEEWLEDSKLYVKYSANLPDSVKLGYAP